MHFTMSFSCLKPFVSGYPTPSSLLTSPAVSLATSRLRILVSCQLSYFLCLLSTWLSLDLKLHVGCPLSIVLAMSSNFAFIYFLLVSHDLL